MSQPQVQKPIDRQVDPKQFKKLLNKVTSLSVDAKCSIGKHSGNAIIHGENLFVLQQLLPHFRQTVRCCYIDPPYNNRERHYHYSDSRLHTDWLGQIVDRVEIIKQMLRSDGSLWISIDDRELHYLKVACDVIFGRQNFVTTIVWEQRTTRENRKVFSNNHEYVLVYAKNLKEFQINRNRLTATDDVLARYRNPDNDPRGPWQSISANVQGGHGTAAQFYKLVAPCGKEHVPPHGRCWVYNIDRMTREISENNIWFGRDGLGVPRIKRFMGDTCPGLTPNTLWKASEVGTNDLAKKQLLKLLPYESVFDTPKPEELVQRIVEIATSEGDLVLDAYLGSGTTAAVAHKLNRHYIGIEEGEHIYSHCLNRMRQVVKGDASGISSAVDWQGGGGFDFYKLST